MVVAVNGDASVRALKGPSRPINAELERAEVLAALGCVDFVTVFHTERVTALVTAIRPQIYAKGGDYTVDSLNPEELQALRAAQSEICILQLVAGKSTTAAPGPGRSRKRTGILNPIPPIPPKKLLSPPEPPEPPEPMATVNPHSTTAATGSALAPLRLGVLGSGKGSNFRAIADAIASGSLVAEVRVVISDVETAEFLNWHARAASARACARGARGSVAPVTAPTSASPASPARPSSCDELREPLPQRLAGGERAGRAGRRRRGWRCARARTRRRRARAGAVDERLERVAAEQRVGGEGVGARGRRRRRTATACCRPAPARRRRR